MGALIHAGQKAGTPQGSAYRGQPGTKDHETRQVLVLDAEPVSDPRAHRRPAREIMAAVHHEKAGIVERTVGVHRADHADFVDAFAKLRENLTHLDSALPAFVKLERRGE